VKKYVEQVDENGKVVERISYKGDHQHDTAKVKTDQPPVTRNSPPSEVHPPKSILLTSYQLPPEPTVEPPTIPIIPA
jgi:hypothetical protein